MKVMVAHPDADIAKENLVVRFSESVDGFPLPKGHSMNPDLQGELRVVLSNCLHVCGIVLTLYRCLRLFSVVAHHLLGTVNPEAQAYLKDRK